jgi:dethiobiotin synthetase
MKTFFITGTDTDCGKTYITCQLLAYFKSQNKRVVGLKPVASGCKESSQGLFSEDELLLNELNPSFAHVSSPWRFKEPIAPHIAAHYAKVNLNIADIADYCFAPHYKNQDIVLIEGAGGLMVPLNEKETWLDFLKYSGIPVILVVGMRLGCINHALLTEAVMNSNQISCAGWIANCLDPNMMALGENISILKERMGMPLITTVPFEGKITHFM